MGPDRARFSYGTNVRFMARISHLPEGTDLVTMTHPEMLPTMNIGETIRNYRLQKGMSQGDIEKRTGLLRCYISRVENGHTVPSVDTLEKLARALEIPMYRFFTEDTDVKKPNIPSQPVPIRLVNTKHDRELRAFAKLISRMNDKNRGLLLHMTSKMANRI